MIKTVTPQELRKALDAAEWNDYTLIETLPDGSEILVGDIFAAIAAAVQEEREACEQIALSANVRHGITRSEIAIGDQVAASIAAAIHSRRNGSK